MKRESKIRQHDKQDCAAACIASICSFYGLHLPLITIRDACGTSDEGTSIQGILDASEKIGMSAKGLKSKTNNIEELKNIDMPIILHLKKENGWLHFVVLYEIKGKRAMILDPEDGNYHRVEIRELEKEWSGYIVIMSPSPTFVKGDERESNLFRFKELFMSHKRELILSLLGSIVYIIIGLSTSLFLQHIIDNILPKKDTTSLIFTAILMIILLVLSLFIGYIRSLLTIRASIKIDARLVISYINKLIELPISFFNSRGSGELNARIGDVYKIRTFISIQLIILTISTISILISISILFTYYWKLALLVLAFIPLYYLLYTISDKINRKINKKIIVESAKFEEKNIETLASIKTIKFFGSKSIASRKLEKQYIKMSQALYSGGKYASLFSMGSEGVTKALTFTVLIIGSYFVINSELTIGEMVSFFSITAFFTSPVMALIESNNEITEANIAAERLFEILDLKSEEGDKKGNYDIPVWDNLTVENLSFSYPGRGKLLENISFAIEKGKINAIVGENGCGKSTIATILMRGYEVQNGKIRIGETNINHISIDKWRKFISIVPQKGDLFNGTIMENIVPGEEEADIDKVISMCRIAGLIEMIRNLPDGLLSNIGEQGCKLSGGERQKVALARALYREPEILILDEATTSLDDKSRSSFIDTIRSICLDKSITIIMISHEKESIEIANKIIEIKTNAHSKVENCTPNFAVSF